jgi:hypothetical protein
MLKNFKYSHCPFCDSGEYYDDKLAIHINNIHPDKLSLVSKLLPTAKFRLCNMCNKIISHNIDKPHKYDSCKTKKIKQISSSPTEPNKPNSISPTTHENRLISSVNPVIINNNDTIDQPGDPLPDPVSEKDPNHSTSAINNNGLNEFEVSNNTDCPSETSLRLSAPNPDTDPREYCRLAKLCIPPGYYLQDVFGDGNCGPRAISLLSCCNEESHTYIREQGIKYLRDRNNWESNEELSIELTKRFWIDNYDNKPSFATKILSYAEAMSKNKAHIDSDVTMLSIAYALNIRIRVWMLTYSKDKGVYLHPIIDWNSYNIAEFQAIDLVYFPGHYQALVRNTDRRSKQLAQFRINTSEVTATMELKELLYKSPTKPASAPRNPLMPAAAPSNPPAPTNAPSLNTSDSYNPHCHSKP